MDYSRSLHGSDFETSRKCVIWHSVLPSKSTLTAGVGDYGLTIGGRRASVEGTFERGDTVRCHTQKAQYAMEPINNTVYTLNLGDAQFPSAANAQRIILLEGREAFSALFRYDLLLGVEGTETQAVENSLGGEAELLITVNGQQLTHICGVITMVACTTQYPLCKTAPALYWYALRIQPPIVRACFSRNRMCLVDTPAKTAAQQLLQVLQDKWGQAFTVSSAAQKRMPRVLQLCQQDESDYNFLVRVLRTWGLGFTFTTEEKPTQNKENKHYHSVMQILDMTEGADLPPSLPGEALPLRHPNRHVPLRVRTLGMPSASTPGAVATLRYGQSPGAAQGRDVNLISAYGESLVENLAEKASAACPPEPFCSAYAPSVGCRGEVSNAPCFPGSLLQWAAGRGCGDSRSYRAVAVRWVDINRRELRAEVTGSCCGAFGMLPVPLEVADSRVLASDPEAELLRELSPAPPTPRTFIAEVTGPGNYHESARNLCKVREIGPVSVNNTEYPNEMWVELGSPFADAGSGILARPRKGNVLLCLDRGDLSMPVVLTSLYRGANTMPTAPLKGNDDSVVNDAAAVTIRNRSYIGEGKDAAVGDATEYSRPCSVYDLREHKNSPNCSQIQLIGRENGVDRDKHTEKLADFSRLASLCGLMSVAQAITSASGGLTSALGAAHSITTRYTSKFMDDFTRGHSAFQGVNIYSEKDLLQQSAGSQFVNAGGAIHITAAESITLRVGRNSITISEAGISLDNQFSSVHNPGASEEYHPEASQENIVCSETPFVTKAHNNITLEQSGVSVSGVSFAADALAGADLSTVFGTGLSLNNFSATLNSPYLTLIGGGHLPKFAECTARLLTTEAARAISSDAADWVSDLWDVGLGVTADVCTQCLYGRRTLLGAFTAPFRVSGSMLVCCPDSMDLYSDVINREGREQYTYTSPISGYRAALENSGAFGKLALQIFTPKVARLLSTTRCGMRFDNLQLSVETIRHNEVAAQEENHALSEYEAVVNNREESVADSSQRVSEREQVVQNQSDRVVDNNNAVSRNSSSQLNNEQSMVASSSANVNTSSSNLQNVSVAGIENHT